MSVTSVDKPKIGEADSLELFRQTYKVNNDKAYLLVKRLFDVTASLIGGAVLLPLMVLVALMIRIESPGPVIYKQERLGKDGKPFMMYKFRSMYLDSEKDGPRWASVQDDRCTKVGRVIRMCHVDELPQLLNILRGEMSIVGPRPEREYFYNEFEKTIPNFRARLLVTPGLTGYAQVNGGYDLTPEEKLAHDVIYMEKRCLWMDLVCILKTFFHILDRKGVR